MGLLQSRAVRSWETIDRAPTSEGDLVLQQRGDEFVIALGGRIIMGNRATRSESELASLACAPLLSLPAPRIVIAGLGLGFTLRAALDALPATAAVTVVELTPKVIDWCRGPLAPAAKDVLADPRVTAIAGDVFETLARLKHPVDAIALDLWEGPLERNDPVFTAARLATCRRALAPGGRVGIWSEQSVAGFEQRLSSAGFAAPRKHVAKRGARHVIYVADVDARRRV